MVGMRSVLIGLWIGTACAWGQATGPGFSTIYTFPSAYPQAPFAVDSSGALYGTTASTVYSSGSIVFKLTPPVPGGSWTETVLFTFNVPAGGLYLSPGLLLDQTGSLYGTAAGGGTSGAGVVFQLSPPAQPGGAWTETVLYNFTGGSDGNSPEAVPVADATGALYGTTFYGGDAVCQCGTVFKLSPPVAPSTTWTESVLHAFTGAATNDGSLPSGPVVFDRAGSLYGTTGGGGQGGGGVVFQLIPPAPASDPWTENILYDFRLGMGNDPGSALTFDNSGALYGTTFSSPVVGGGTIFMLTPPGQPGGAWTETDLHRFRGPDGGGPLTNLLMDNHGDIFGVTQIGGLTEPNCIYGCGTVFKLLPPRVAGENWRLFTIYKFTGQSDGGYPYAGVSFGTSKLTIFGAAGYTVFEVTR